MLRGGDRLLRSGDWKACNWSVEERWGRIRICMSMGEKTCISTDLYEWRLGLVAKEKIACVGDASTPIATSPNWEGGLADKDSAR